MFQSGLQIFNRAALELKARNKYHDVIFGLCGAHFISKILNFFLYYIIINAVLTSLSLRALFGGRPLLLRFFLSVRFIS